MAYVIFKICIFKKLVVCITKCKYMQFDSKNVVTSQRLLVAFFKIFIAYIQTLVLSGAEVFAKNILPPFPSQLSQPINSSTHSSASLTTNKLINL